MLRRLFCAGASGLLVLAMAGCSSNDGAPTPPATTAPAAVPLPRNGACYVLDVAAALQISNAAPPVGCGKRHTAVTVLVGTVSLVVGGKERTIDAASVQGRIASRCRTRVAEHVGGTLEQQRLSRVQAVWFSPPPQAVAAGAHWFRCDLVIGATSTSFAALPRSTRRLLDAAGALDHFGICGTAAPGAANFTRVLCSSRHRWRARATIDLPAGTAYLGKAAGRAADSACRDVEARRAASSLTLRWSFEWPTKVEWRAGQRYGLCWTPD